MLPKEWQDNKKKYLAKLEISCNNFKKCSNIFSILKVETSKQLSERGNVEIAYAEPKLIILFIAKDLTMLRTLLNSYLRLLRVILSVSNYISQSNAKSSQKTY